MKSTIALLFCFDARVCFATVRLIGNCSWPWLRAKTGSSTVASLFYFAQGPFNTRFRKQRFDQLFLAVWLLVRARVTRNEGDARGEPWWLVCIIESLLNTLMMICNGCWRIKTFSFCKIKCGIRFGKNERSVAFAAISTCTSYFLCANVLSLIS